MTIAEQVWIQAKSVLFTAAWSGIGSFAILKLLDLAMHDERAYNH